MKIKLGLAEALARKDPEKAAELMHQLRADTDETLETLRDLARGIYPPLLADQGLVAALEGQARKATMTVAVEANRIDRYTQEIEAAVYFCVLEALQNVQKYAEAKTVAIRLEQHDSDLAFEVTDDGDGFDPASTQRGAPGCRTWRTAWMRWEGVSTSSRTPEPGRAYAVTFQSMPGRPRDIYPARSDP